MGDVRKDVAAQVTTTQAVISHVLVNKWEQDLRSGCWNHHQTDWVSWAEDEWTRLLGSFLLRALNSKAVWCWAGEFSGIIFLQFSTSQPPNTSPNSKVLWLILWQSSSADYTIVYMCQGWGFNPWSGHSQNQPMNASVSEMTNQCFSLSPPSSLSL